MKDENGKDDAPAKVEPGRGAVSGDVAVQAGGTDLIGGSGFQPLKVNRPMATLKKFGQLIFVAKATNKFSFHKWRPDNDYFI